MCSGKAELAGANDVDDDDEEEEEAVVSATVMAGRAGRVGSALEKVC
jgi:hypothetical protein